MSSNPEQARGKELTTEEKWAELIARYDGFLECDKVNIHAYGTDRFWQVWRTGKADPLFVMPSIGYGSNRDEAIHDAWQHLQGAEAKAETRTPFYGNTECALCNEPLRDKTSFRKPTIGGEMLVCDKCSSGPIASVGGDETDEAWVKAHGHPNAWCLPIATNSNGARFRIDSEKHDCFVVLGSGLTESLAWENARESAPTAAEPVLELSGMALDMAVVRVNWQDAWRTLVAGEWFVLPQEHSKWGEFIGRAATETEAWTDAAAKVIDAEYEIIEPSPSDRIWLRDREEDAWVGTYDIRELALESAKRDYIAHHAVDAKNAAEPVLGKSETKILARPYPTDKDWNDAHQWWLDVLPGNRERAATLMHADRSALLRDKRDSLAMQAKYAAMMERQHAALEDVADEYGYHDNTHCSFGVNKKSMSEARATLAAYREMGLEK